MITVGLIGAADPRHGWFLAALHRRRAGVRIVGLSDPDPALRQAFSHQYDLPTWADHGELLTVAKPSLIAMAQPHAGGTVIDSLRAGTDVLVMPPICGTVAELDEISELVRSTGRRVTAVHTLCGHPAARTAKELVDSGRLGRPDLVSLIVGPDCIGDELKQAVAEAVQLFGWLTGTTSGSSGAGADDPEEAAAFGRLIVTIEGLAADGRAATLEVRRSELATGARIIQVAGNAGAVEWDAATGLLRSSIDGREPATVACGPFADPAEWVLTNLLRKPRPVISTEQSLATARLALSAITVAG